MALSVHTNSTALAVQRSQGEASSNLKQSMMGLSTGLRINNAVDDSAGLRIASRLQVQDSALSLSRPNSNDGVGPVISEPGKSDISINQDSTQIRDAAKVEISEPSKEQIAAIDNRTKMMEAARNARNEALQIIQAGSAEDTQTKVQDNATETANLQRFQVRQQAGISIYEQANQRQSVLPLLQ